MRRIIKLLLIDGLMIMSLLICTSCGKDKESDDGGANNKIIQSTFCVYGETSAAISKEDVLYMWGNNEYGQFGSGNTIDSDKPVKIMENVASVSLGECHSAIISKKGG